MGDQKTPKDGRYSHINSGVVTIGTKIIAPKDFCYGLLPLGKWQEFNGANGAISLTSYGTRIDLQGTTRTYTLANGIHKGQLKIIRVINTGEGETPVARINLVTGTFEDTTNNQLNLDAAVINGQAIVTLQWHGFQWVIGDLLNGSSGGLANQV